MAFIAAEASEKQNGRGRNGQTTSASFSAELQQALVGIEQSLSSRLPRYMVPTTFIPLWEMPLLVSCKTDRKQLHEIGQAMSKQQLARLRAQAVEKLAPRTETERVLHALCTRLFGGDVEICLEDNYFALGGDSLKAMRLIAAARAEGLALTAADIFTHPTLADMASVAHHAGTDAETEVPAFSLLRTDWGEDARSDAAKMLAPMLRSCAESTRPWSRTCIHVRRCKRD